VFFFLLGGLFHFFRRQPPRVHLFVSSSSVSSVCILLSCGVVRARRACTSTAAKGLRPPTRLRLPPALMVLLRLLLLARGSGGSVGGQAAMRATALPLAAPPRRRPLLPGFLLRLGQARPVGLEVVRSVAVQVYPFEKAIKATANSETQEITFQVLGLEAVGFTSYGSN
jgi:hypothetical protein